MFTVSAPVRARRWEWKFLWRRHDLRLCYALDLRGNTSSNRTTGRVRRVWTQCAAATKETRTRALLSLFEIEDDRKVAILARVLALAPIAA